MKDWIKGLAVDQLGRHGAVAPGKRIVVLVYHSVHPTHSVASVRPDRFEQHLQWLKANCDIVNMDQVLKPASTDSGRPRVVITFDDGYADNFEYAFPLLQTYETPATFFLTAGLIEHDEAVISDTMTLRHSDYEGIRPLTWAQIDEMRRAGMTFEAHTYTHPNLARLDRRQATLELQVSKDLIEQRLGEPVVGFAYPFGKPGRHFTDETKVVVREVGYHYAAAVTFRGVQPTDSRWAIPRFFVIHDDVKTLSDKVYGYWDWLGTWQQKAPQWLARMVSPRDYRV